MSIESARGTLASRGVIGGQLNRETGVASNTTPVAGFSTKSLEDLAEGQFFSGTLRRMVLSKTPSTSLGLEVLLQLGQWTPSYAPNFPALSCIPRHQGERYTHKAQYSGY